MIIAQLVTFEVSCTNLDRSVAFDEPLGFQGWAGGRH